jgi:hypothetical protein
MSIASTTIANGLEGVIPFLTNSAVNDLLSVYSAINPIDGAKVWGHGTISHRPKRAAEYGS